MCVCVFQRGAQRTTVNNDITSASMHLSLPPTGRVSGGSEEKNTGVSGMKGKCVFAPGG